MSLQRLFARGSPLGEKDSSEDYKKEDITIRFTRKLAEPIIPKIEPISIITPNRLTWFGFFWVILGAGILSVADDNILLLFSVGLCYWIAHYFDIVDGMLARARNASSSNGKWLDSVLEEGKGFFFFLGLGLNIQDTTGYFVLNLLGTDFGPFNVWMILFIMYGVERWIALMALWGNYVLDEPRVVSSGNIYMIWIILIFNLLELFLVLYTIGVILAATWTLFEKTFLFSPTQTSQAK
jgi:phosphatidylglycerophosphate synthase